VMGQRKFSLNTPFAQFFYSKRGSRTHGNTFDFSTSENFHIIFA